MTLQEFFAENARAAIAFSGGVDSSYLLYAAVQCGADVHAYFAKTAFQPRFELDDARRLAESVGARLTVLELDALSSEDVARNPANRCYYCKQNIFGNLKRAAAEDGFTLILDGTNASDDAGDRPGMRALREMDVRSPLRECGLTKAEIRRLSHEADDAAARIGNGDPRPGVAVVNGKNSHGASVVFYFTNTAQLQLQPTPDIFRRSIGLKRLRYTKYICAFQVLSRQKISRSSLAELCGAFLSL